MQTILRHIRAISRIAALILTIAMTTFAPGPANADSVSGSIAYDKLNLTTPDGALREFLSAYRDGDFVTAFWIFTPSAQEEWYRRLVQFRFGTLVRGFVPKDEALIHDLIPRHKKPTRPTTALSSHT